MTGKQTNKLDKTESSSVEVTTIPAADVSQVSLYGRQNVVVITRTQIDGRHK